MNKWDLLRVFLMSLLLLLLLSFYYVQGFFNFNYAEINEELPKPVAIDKSFEDFNVSEVDVSTANKSNLGFELVGIRGNNPESTIIILEKDSYRLVEQGQNISSSVIFSHIDGSRAYFFDGQTYTFLDIIGTETSFNKNRIN
tara:strand:- start:468 stop:893 length:426 start_codon:yes stop_codon:yes gene_type:complete